MLESLTPNQVARALMVSESSVKRWCDRGMIETRYTAGGHRRIPKSGLVRFLRSRQLPLARPDVLGLPASPGGSRRSFSSSVADLSLALQAGDELQCRRIVVDLYLAEHSLATIFDHVLAPAFWEIGHSWSCGALQIYQERRACQIAVRALYDLQTLVGIPADGAPLAIGGTIEGDHYSLAASMVELVLRDTGWNAILLGSDLPLHSFAAAIHSQRPRLFWLSCSFLESPDAFMQEIVSLHRECCRETAFVIGGRAVEGRLKSSIEAAASGQIVVLETMQHLQAYARSLIAPRHNG